MTSSMIFYHIHAACPFKHQLEITCTFTAETEIVKIQIPYWRPGRYEPGNFPRNYINFSATSNGEPLQSRKVSANLLEIQTTPGAEVSLSYINYAGELTAGNTFFDPEILLINPVNCLVYPLGMEKVSSRLALTLPEGWKYGTSFEQDTDEGQEDNKVTFIAANLQELLDTPILASADLRTLKYEIEDTPFFIHINGGQLEDEEKLLADFRAFTKVQYKAFGSFPVDQYHFLLLFLPVRAYHGVEHDKSTVIIIGPMAELNQELLYRELLGVSSHELYHTWNVKYLRPANWSPYDFSQPVHSRLGYVAEGVTTYMGDWMLWQSGIFSDNEFWNELSTHVQRHLENEGRFHLSLGDASIDTWTDGYIKSQPRRRVSIYAEGAMLSFVCDVWLLQGSGICLSDYMREFNNQYGGPSGFSEDDWWDGLKATCDLPWDHLRADVVENRGKLYGYFLEALDMIGLEVREEASANFRDAAWGSRIDRINEEWVVQNVLMNSPAEKAGLWFGDRILSVNGIHADHFFEQSLHKSPDSGVSLEILSGYRSREVRLETDGQVWMKKYTVMKKNEQLPALFHTWKNTLNVLKIN